MSEEELYVLRRMMPRFKARRRLDQLRDSGKRLTAEGLYDAVLAAYGDRDLAERAMRDQMADDLRNNRVPQ